MRTTGHGIHVKQKAAQHYCQNTLKKAVHRQNNAFYIQIFPLSKAKESQKKKKKISSEGHILFAFDELKCKKTIKASCKRKKNKTNTELLESDDLVDGWSAWKLLGMLQQN